MAELLFGVATFLIAFPIVFFIVFYLLQILLFRKRKMAAFGRAADAVTLLLFLAVPAVVYAFWKLNILSYLLIFSLLIGIVLTLIEWKTQREVLILPLLRKIWRTLFLVFNVLYLGAFVVGAIQFISRYMS